jgi:hypothetical protein
MNPKPRSFLVLLPFVILIGVIATGIGLFFYGCQNHDARFIELGGALSTGIVILAIGLWAVIPNKSVRR